MRDSGKSLPDGPGGSGRARPATFHRTDVLAAMVEQPVIVKMRGHSAPAAPPPPKGRKFWPVRRHSPSDAPRGRALCCRHQGSTPGRHRQFKSKILRRLPAPPHKAVAAWPPPLAVHRRATVNRGAFASGREFRILASEPCQQINSSTSPSLVRASPAFRTCTAQGKQGSMRSYWKHATGSVACGAISRLGRTFRSPRLIGHLVTCPWAVQLNPMFLPTSLTGQIDSLCGMTCG